MDSKPLKIPMVSEGAEKYFGTVWNLYWLTIFVADQPDSQTQFQYVYFIKNGN